MRKNLEELNEKKEEKDISWFTFFLLLIWACLKDYIIDTIVVCVAIAIICAIIGLFF